MRAQKRKAALTSMVLGPKLAFFLAARSIPKSAGLLKVEAHCPQPKRLAPRLLSTLMSDQTLRALMTNTTTTHSVDLVDLFPTWHFGLRRYVIIRAF